MFNLSVNFEDMKRLDKQIFNFNKKYPENNIEGIKELGKFIEAKAKFYAPKGATLQLVEGIKLTKVSKDSFEIESTATNPYTGEPYGYIQETGDYSVAKYRKLPVSYAAALKYGLLKHRGLIFRIRKWARKKAPQLLMFNKWFTPSGFTPYLAPAFEDAGFRIEDIMKRKSEGL